MSRGSSAKQLTLFQSGFGAKSHGKSGARASGKNNNCGRTASGNGLLRSVQTSAPSTSSHVTDSRVNDDVITIDDSDEDDAILAQVAACSESNAPYETGSRGVNGHTSTVASSHMRRTNDVQNGSSSSAICEADAELPPDLDADASATWIYPVNYQLRQYQYNIVHTALFANTLVALPTGLGKTFIAAVVMYNFYRWYPCGRVVFMAPTRPLVAQQIRACHSVVGIPPADTAVVTGAMSPAARRDMWQSRRVFFLTPQVLVNDLASGVIDPHQIRCVVVDEAHRAQGNYAYCLVIGDMIRRQCRHFRVLALTASPGSVVENIQKVIVNLMIARVENRTEQSLDIAPYCQRRSLERVVVPADDTLTLYRHRLLDVISFFMRRIRQRKLVYGRSDLDVTKFALLKARDNFRQCSAGSGVGVDNTAIETDFAVSISLYHALELLSVHGLRSCFQFIQGTLTGDRVCGRTKAALKRHDGLTKLMSELEAAFGDNRDATDAQQRPALVSHPKLEKLCQIVGQHFENSSSDTTRVMVFSQYRDSVLEIVAALRPLQPVVRAMHFVGQNSSRSTHGFTQKEQLKVIAEFRAGGYNTLVCTCVGEEGLDIGEVDLIVCYDVSRSPIRLVQRMGRTGRRRDGRIVVLLSEGREQAAFNHSMNQRNTLANALCDGKRFQSHLYTDSRRMVPAGVFPRCQKLHMHIPSTDQPGNNKDNNNNNNNNNKDVATTKRRRGGANVRGTRKKCRTASDMANDTANVKDGSGGRRSNMLTRLTRVTPPTFDISAAYLQPDELKDWRDRFHTTEDVASVGVSTSVGEWLPYQTELHASHLIGHSHVSRGLVAAMQYISRLASGDQCAAFADNRATLSDNCDGDIMPVEPDQSGLHQIGRASCTVAGGRSPRCDDINDDCGWLRVLDTSDGDGPCCDNGRWSPVRDPPAEFAGWPVASAEEMATAIEHAVRRLCGGRTSCGDVMRGRVGTDAPPTSLAVGGTEIASPFGPVVESRTSDVCRAANTMHNGRMDSDKVDRETSTVNDGIKDHLEDLSCDFIADDSGDATCKLAACDANALSASRGPCTSRLEVETMKHQDAQQGETRVDTTRGQSSTEDLFLDDESLFLRAISSPDDKVSSASLAQPTSVPENNHHSISTVISCPKAVINQNPGSCATPASVSRVSSELHSSQTSTHIMVTRIADAGLKQPPVQSAAGLTPAGQRITATSSSDLPLFDLILDMDPDGAANAAPLTPQRHPQKSEVCRGLREDTASSIDSGTKPSTAAVSASRAVASVAAGSQQLLSITQLLQLLDDSCADEATGPNLQEEPPACSVGNVDAQTSCAADERPMFSLLDDVFDEDGDDLLAGVVMETSADADVATSVGVAAAVATPQKPSTVIFTNAASHSTPLVCAARGQTVLPASRRCAVDCDAGLLADVSPIVRRPTASSVTPGQSAKHVRFAAVQRAVDDGNCASKDQHDATQEDGIVSGGGGLDVSTRSSSGVSPVVRCRSRRRCLRRRRRVLWDDSVESQRSAAASASPDGRQPAGDGSCGLAPDSDGSGDDFAAAAISNGRLTSQRRCSVSSDAVTVGAAATQTTARTSPSVKRRHKARRRAQKPGNPFIELEADVSRDLDAVSSDERDSQLARSQDDSLIDDSYLATQPGVDMRAVYLRSVRSPRGAGGGGSSPPRARAPLSHSQIFSQTPQQDTQYLQDSFCVSDGPLDDDTTQSSSSESPPFCRSLPSGPCRRRRRKRRRVIMLDSSDGSDTTQTHEQAGAPTAADLCSLQSSSQQQSSPSCGAVLSQSAGGRDRETSKTACKADLSLTEAPPTADVGNTARLWRLQRARAKQQEFRRLATSAAPATTSTPTMGTFSTGQTAAVSSTSTQPVFVAASTSTQSVSSSVITAGTAKPADKRETRSPHHQPLSSLLLNQCAVDGSVSVMLVSCREVSVVSPLVSALRCQSDIDVHVVTSLACEDYVLSCRTAVVRVQHDGVVCAESRRRLVSRLSQLRHLYVRPLLLLEATAKPPCSSPVGPLSHLPPSAAAMPRALCQLLAQLVVSGVQVLHSQHHDDSARLLRSVCVAECAAGFSLCRPLSPSVRSLAVSACATGGRQAGRRSGPVCARVRWLCCLPGCSVGLAVRLLQRYQCLADIAVSCADEMYRRVEVVASRETCCQISQFLRRRLMSDLIGGSSVADQTIPHADHKAAD